MGNKWPVFWGVLKPGDLSIPSKLMIKYRDETEQRRATWPIHHAKGLYFRTENQALEALSVFEANEESNDNQWDIVKIHLNSNATAPPEIWAPWIQRYGWADGKVVRWRRPNDHPGPFHINSVGGRSSAKEATTVFDAVKLPRLAFSFMCFKPG